MNYEKVVCPCANDTVGMIKDAVDSGASTLEEVQNKTDAANFCGVCTDEVQRCIDYFATERDNQEQLPIDDGRPRRDGPGGE